MQTSKVNTIIELFCSAFQQVGAEVPIKKTENMAGLIVRSMDGGRRNFHTTEHVITICRTTKGIQTLAALFHDVVYYQVDDGFPNDVAELLAKYTIQKDNKVFVALNEQDDFLFSLCLEIFGFSYGQELSPFSGLNEFLSAVVAVTYLDQLVSENNLIAIATCIEGTIPFRDHQSFVDLQHRLQILKTKYNLVITDEQIDYFVKISVDFANKDVENFASDDAAHFLDNTWILLPETNAFLLKLYTIQEYRTALFKMEGFMSILKPQNIFHHYKDFPSQSEFQHLQEMAQKNVKIAQGYLGAKLFTMAVLESLAMMTGGDVPVTTFLGDGNSDGDKAEMYLPDIKASDDCDPIILSLLETGRSSESFFDIKHSPLSAFAYKLLGKNKITDFLAISKKIFSQEITYKEFLSKIDKELVTFIATACSHVAISRKDDLMKIIESL